MENMKIMEVFRNLSAENLEELEVFLASDFVNKTYLKFDVIRLFHLLRETYPAFNPERLDKNRIYNLLYDGAPFIKGKLEKTAAELNKLIKTYLLWEHYWSDENEFARSLNWSGVLLKFSLTERHDQFLKRVEKDYFDSNRPLSPEFYMQQFLLEYQRHMALSAANDARSDINLFATIDSLNVFFEIYRLELLNRLLSQQFVTQLEITPAITHNLGTVFQLVPEDANIILKISSLIHHLLQKKQPTMEDFSGLRSLLQANEDNIAPEYLVEYYTYLRNFCTFLILKGDDNLIPVLHLLHRDSLERGYMFVGDNLQANSYLNITKNAINADNIPWAVQFVEKYKDRVVGETEKGEFYLINKAQCLFAQKKYEDALTILPPTSENTTYYRMARRLEIMCHYELQSESIISKIEAFKMLIRRASEKFLTPELRDQNYNFANFLYQIVNTRPGDINRAARIAARIKSKKPVAESHWLLSVLKRW